MGENLNWVVISSKKNWGYNLTFRSVGSDRPQEILHSWDDPPAVYLSCSISQSPAFSCRTIKSSWRISKDVDCSVPPMLRELGLINHTTSIFVWIPDCQNKVVPTSFIEHQSICWHEPQCESHMWSALWKWVAFTRNGCLNVERVVFLGVFFWGGGIWFWGSMFVDIIRM